MADPLDTSSLPPITINSGKPEPIEECVSVWEVESDEELVAAVRAIDEAEMYDAPATTHATINRAADRIEAQAAEIARLRGALAPLAGITADDGDDFSSYDPQTIIRCEVTAGDIQAARAALSHKNEAPRD